MSSKPGKNRKKAGSVVEKKPDWFAWALIALAGLLLFYPPYVQGLYFKPQIFVFHLLTGGVIILAVIYKWQRRDSAVVTSPLDWAILAYAGAYALSLISAVHIGEAVYGFLQALNYFMIYWLVTQVIKDSEAVKVLLKIIIISGLGVAIIGILAATGLINYPQAMLEGHIISTMGYHNTLAALLSVLTLITVSLLINEKNRWWQMFYWVASYLMLLVVMAAVSKGAWLILIVGVLLLFTGMPQGYRFKVVYFLMAAIGAAVVVSNYFIPIVTSETPAVGIWVALSGVLAVLAAWKLWELIERRMGSRSIQPKIKVAIMALLLVATIVAITQVGLSDRMVKEISEITDSEDMSFVTRTDFMRWGILIIKDYPVIGTGAGGWPALYMQYQDYNFWTIETHSHIFRVAIETGLIGLSAYISMWIVFLYLIYSLYRGHRNNADKSEWILIWGIASAAMGLGLHSCFDFDLSIPAIALLLWTLFALISVYYAKGSVKPARPETGLLLINSAIVVILALLLILGGGKFLLAFGQESSGQHLQKAAASSQEIQTRLDLFDLANSNMELAVKNDPLNADYWAEYAAIQAYLYVINDEQGEFLTDHRNNSISAMNRAADLNPNDPLLLGYLMKIAMQVGDVQGVEQFGKMRVQSSPNRSDEYTSVAQYWWDTSMKCEEYNEHDTAVKFARDIIDLHKDLRLQMSRVNPDHPFWQGDKLTVTPEFEGIYNEAQEFLTADSVPTE